MDKKIRNIVVIAGIVVASVLGFYFLSYNTKSEEVAKLKKEISALDQKLFEAEEHKQRIVQLQREIDDLELALKYAKEKLPSDEELTQIIDDIHKLGTVESNISIESFVPEANIRKEIYYEKPYKMRVIGGFHQIASFFNKIGNLNRIINIDDLKIQPGRSDYEIATFVLKAYIYSEEPQTTTTTTTPRKRTGGAQ